MRKITLGHVMAAIGVAVFVAIVAMWLLAAFGAPGFSHGE
jgi:hypothetical protein